MSIPSAVNVIVQADKAMNSARFILLRSIIKPQSYSSSWFFGIITTHENAEIFAAAATFKSFFRKGYELY